MSEKFEVNGETITIKPTISKFERTAHTMSQRIYNDFKKIGITEEFIDLPIPRNPLSYGASAQISWRVNEEEFYYQCKTQERFVDNLGVLSKVIYAESYAIRNGLKSFAQVMSQFKIGFDPDGKKIRQPYEILGIDKGTKDKDYIKYKYKQLSKELHPDNGGDSESFIELQEAYEELMRNE